MSVFEARRRVMVESQLRTNKVVDEGVIHAFQTIPREAFLPEALRGLAYIDDDLVLVPADKSGDKTTPARFMLAPMVMARLVQALALTPNSHVLHIAANCGYGTAILAQLCQSVVGIEEDAALAETAAQNLISEGVDNGVVVHAHHSDGYPTEAPYDAILIEGGVAEIPKHILSQLAGDKATNKNKNHVHTKTSQTQTKGRLVTIHRATPDTPGKAVMIEMSDYSNSNGNGGGNSVGAAQHILFDAQTPILPAFAKEEAFTFA